VHSQLYLPCCFTNHNHAVQMPTGTGKTITLLSLITSYQLAHPEVRHVHIFVSFRTRQCEGWQDTHSSDILQQLQNLRT
jgi:Rad3-related DNA helicase